MGGVPTFHVVPGTAVKAAIDGNRQQAFEAIETAYRLHAAGETVNPDSYFLRYPDKPRARIIALPAHLGGAAQKSGIKWIASFPDNIATNLARASAVQILNDATTGYPLACIEASMISATRTAASAALAAEHMSATPLEGTLGVIGTGIIARTTIEWLLIRGWKFREVHLFDLDPSQSERFAQWLHEAHGLRATIPDSLESTLRGSSLIVFTTTAPEPYIADEGLFGHAPTVLHLSLRDICENVILSSQNVVDDVEHCLKANTSLHIAEQKTGNRDFVRGTLVDVLDGKLTLERDGARIFSPFGLGVLDIALANLVYEAAVASGTAIAVPDFFSNSTRW